MTSAVVTLLALAAFGFAGRQSSSLSTAAVGTEGWAALPVVAAAIGAWILAATLVFARSTALGFGRSFRWALLINVLLVGFTVLLFARTSWLAVAFGSRGYPRAGDLEDRWSLQLDVPLVRHLPTVLLALLALVLVAALLTGLGVLVWWLLPAGVRRDWRVRAMGVGSVGLGRRVSASPETALTTIVRVREALHTGDEPRRAIIAAYAAMEHAVQAQGVERRAAQTPAEFLVRALADDLFQHRDAAEQLLDLFELARFSTLPLPADAVTVADRALGVLEADLQHRLDPVAR